MQATPEKTVAPYRHQEFPTYVFTEQHRKGLRVENPDQYMALAAVGPVFDNPADLPPAKEVVAVDLNSEIEKLKAENAELRQLNGDLVAKLQVKAEKPAKAEKPVKADDAK